MTQIMRSVFLSVCFISSVWLLGCATAPRTQPDETNQPPPYTFVDSTLYFAEQTASVSLRATFHQEKSAGMAKGYQFQFRTISQQPVFLNSISLVAGGKRLFIEEGQSVLPANKGITFRVSLDDSRWLASYPSALLQFKYNGQSVLKRISLHRLEEFTLTP